MLCYVCLGVKYIVLKAQMRLVPCYFRENTKRGARTAMGGTLHWKFGCLTISAHSKASTFHPSPVSSLDPMAIHKDTCPCHYRSQGRRGIFSRVTRDAHRTHRSPESRTIPKRWESYVIRLHSILRGADRLRWTGLLLDQVRSKTWPWFGETQRRSPSTYVPTYILV